MSLITSSSSSSSTFTVYATHDFHAENDDELSFCQHDLILVLETDEAYNDGWWQGKNRDGFVGLFPAVFVSQTPPQATTHHHHHHHHHPSQLAEQDDLSDDDSTNDSSDKHLSTSTRSSAPDSGAHSKEIHSSVNDDVAQLVKAAIAAVRADGTPVPESETEHQNSDPSTFQISKDYEHMMHELELLKDSFREENQTDESDIIEQVVENLAMAAPSDSISSLQSPPTQTVPAKKKKHPKDWDIQDVSDWLTEKGFSGEVKSFVENEISGPILLELDLTSLKELGLSSFGKRFNIMHAVADLKEEWEIGILPPSAQRFLPSLTLSASPRNSDVGESANSPSDSHGRSVTDSGSFNISRSSVEGSSTYRREASPSLGLNSPPPTSPNVVRTYPPVVDVPQRQFAAYSASSAAPVKPERDSRRPYSTVYVDRSGPLPPLTSANSRNVAGSPPRSSADQQLSNPRSAQQSGAYSGHNPTGVSIPRVPPHATLPSGNPSQRPSATRDMDQPTEPTTPAFSNDSVGPPVTTRPLPKGRPTATASRPGPINCLEIDGSKFLNDADRSGWLNRQGGAIKTWRKRWFSMKEGVLYYQKHPGDKGVLGAVPLKGYKIIPDVNIYRGKYCWKIKHERLKSHFFYTDDKDEMKDWLKSMIKATIALDTNAPVISSYAAKTVPLHVAQDMQPRPPSVSQKIGRDLPSYVLRGEFALSNRNSERANPLPMPLPPPPASALPEPPVSSNSNRQMSLPTPSQENIFDEEEDESGGFMRTSKTGLRPFSEESGARGSQFYDDEIGVQPLRNANEAKHWINYVLSGKKITVSDLHDDLRTGTMLLMIVEEASGRRYHKRLETPSFTFQMIDNLVSVFKFMESLGIATTTYTVKDIFSGDEQQMVRMCNSIRMAFPAIA